jgi:predicted RNA-binding Zn ribbon-like protein
MGIVWILSSTDGAGKILERTVELRETIYWTFTANILDKAASDGDLVTLNQELREALAPLRLSTELGGLYTRFRVEW